jgi:hypothetical protein
MVGLLRLQLLDIGLKAVEPALPDRALLGDPALGGGERRRLDPAGAHPPLLLAAHQPARFEQLEVLQHGGKRHAQRLRQLADRRRRANEAREHAAAGRVGERLEGEVEAGRLVKHVLK